MKMKIFLLRNNLTIKINYLINFYTFSIKNCISITYSNIYNITNDRRCRKIRR